jgi:hypothetical protein
MSDMQMTALLVDALQTCLSSDSGFPVLGKLVGAENNGSRGAPHGDTIGKGLGVPRYLQYFTLLDTDASKNPLIKKILERSTFDENVDLASIDYDYSCK